MQVIDSETDRWRWALKAVVARERPGVDRRKSRPEALGFRTAVGALPFMPAAFDSPGDSYPFLDLHANGQGSQVAFSRPTWSPSRDAVTFGYGFTAQRPGRSEIGDRPSEIDSAPKAEPALAAKTDRPCKRHVGLCRSHDAAFESFMPCWREGAVTARLVPAADSGPVAGDRVRHDLTPSGSDPTCARGRPFVTPGSSRSSARPGDGL